jgi:hypothetical protein
MFNSVLLRRSRPDLNCGAAAAVVHQKAFGISSESLEKIYCDEGPPHFALAGALRSV